MLIPELQNGLQNLTGRNITQTELGLAMGNLKRQTVNTRIKNNSEVTVSELLNAQREFNVSWFICTDDPNLSISENSLNRLYDETVPQKLESCGGRIADIQDKNNLSSFQMAGLLNISEKELADIVNGKILPDIRVLNNLKQNFKVSIDWVLYGE